MKRSLAAIFALMLAAPACGDSSAPVDTDTPTTPSNNGTGGKGDIIGDDDRRDEFSRDVTDAMRAIGRSTAMIVQNEILSDDGDGHLRLAGHSLGDSYYMCPGEAFREQPVTGMCTAWLVAPDVVVTNGHCVTSQPDCDAKSFVFDYAITEEDQDLTRVPAENVVACDRVLAWDYTNNCDVDFAVIKLARPVEGREPLQIRQPDEALKGDNLVIIGHPFGLPRKYAIHGEVLAEGDNAFQTTHDIFGGNSGSGIFDAETGQVQGLVTCGGSNYEWQYWDEGWRLDRKTGRSCDESCDDEGLLTDGTWEGTCRDGDRYRCVCDGEQLVLEKRPCLGFEDDTQGQCTREYRASEFTCQTAPWLCATPQSQHTRHFAHFVDAWQIFTRGEALEVGPGESQTSTIDVADGGHIQAASVYLDFLGDADWESFNADYAVADLTLTLRHEGPDGELTIDLVTPEGYAPGTTYELSNVPGLETRPLEIPFLLPELSGRALSGTWTLTVENAEHDTYVLHDWHLQVLTKDDPAALLPYRTPCVGEGCDFLVASWPDPIQETFEGEARTIDEPQVVGTLTEGWEVELLDPEGVDYEVFKTRRSQTMSLSRGEFAITRDFGEELGHRQLTIDYRYDGDGWFQVWADDHILFGKTAFAQATETIALPESARTLKFVVGATDDSRPHELTLYNLTISPPAE